MIYRCYANIFCSGQNKNKTKQQQQKHPGKLRTFFIRLMAEYIFAHLFYIILCKIKRMSYNYIPYSRFITQLKENLCNVHNMIIWSFCTKSKIRTVYMCTYVCACTCVHVHSQWPWRKIWKAHQLILIGYFSGVRLKEMVGWDLQDKSLLITRFI